MYCNYTSNMTLDNLLKLDKSIPVMSSNEFYKNLINNNQNLSYYDLINSYKKYRMDLPIYKEINKLYNIFLEDLLDEIDKTKLSKSTLSTLMLVKTLIDNGLLSYTKKFYKIGPPCGVDSKYILDFNMIGIYILAGYGICRNIGSFISDLLTKKDIISDKLLCTIYPNGNINNIKYDSNHLINGTIENNNYHLIDVSNNSYSILQDADVFYDDITRSVIIPDFKNNLGGLLQSKINWQENIPYKPYLQSEVIECQEELNSFIRHDGIKIFQEFKVKHFDTLEKLAYLLPIELERTEIKEQQKVKTIKKK